MVAGIGGSVDLFAKRGQHFCVGSRGALGEDLVGRGPQISPAKSFFRPAVTGLFRQSALAGSGDIVGAGLGLAAIWFGISRGIRLGTGVMGWPGAVVRRRFGAVVMGWPGAAVMSWRGAVVMSWRGAAVMGWRGAAVMSWPGAVVMGWRGAVVMGWRGAAVMSWRGAAVMGWRGAAVMSWPGAAVRRRLGAAARVWFVVGASQGRHVWESPNLPGGGSHLGKAHLPRGEERRHSRHEGPHTCCGNEPSCVVGQLHASADPATQR